MYSNLKNFLEIFDFQRHYYAGTADNHGRQLLPAVDQQKNGDTIFKRNNLRSH